MRCADYHRPGGITITSTRGRVITRNVIMVLDPESLRPISTTEAVECDSGKRHSCATYGYEDLRLFEVGSTSEILGIATTFQLREFSKPEMVIVHFGERGEIASVDTIRGNLSSSWSDFAQKNWAPFDRFDVPRFLYSIERGITFNAKGPETENDPKWCHVAKASSFPRGGEVTYSGSVETRMMTPRQPAAGAPPRIMYDWSAPGLRGGSQLIKLRAPTHRGLLGVDPDMWLGIGHEIGRAGYEHRFYQVTTAGALVARSQPFKLSSCGVEFAAGIAIWPDRDRLVVSYGIEDDRAELGETTLSAVLAILEPMEKASP
jgi:hypothetical protein